jgi:ATP-dependent DNA ligase
MPVSCSVIGRVTTTKIGFDVDLSGWLNVQGDCKLGLEGIVSKRLDAPYKSGPSKIWLKIKNPKAPTATRAVNGTF